MLFADDSSMFDHLDPSNFENSDDPIPAKSIYRNIEISSTEELRNDIRSLDKYQRMVLNVAVKYAKDVVKARNNFSFKLFCKLYS